MLLSCDAAVEDGSFSELCRSLLEGHPIRYVFIYEYSRDSGNVNRTAPFKLCDTLFEQFQGNRLFRAERLRQGLKSALHVLGAGLDQFNETKDRFLQFSRDSSIRVYFLSRNQKNAENVELIVYTYTDLANDRPKHGRHTSSFGQQRRRLVQDLRELIDLGD
jgi:hypothetical protein